MARAPEEICVTVTEAVAEVLERPVEDLPPLSEAVDIDALEALVASTDDPTAPGVTVTFTYSGLRVLVHSGQIVYVRPARDPGEEPSPWYPS